MQATRPERQVELKRELESESEDEVEELDDELELEREREVEAAGSPSPPLVMPHVEDPLDDIQAPSMHEDPQIG